MKSILLSYNCQSKSNKIGTPFNYFFVYNYDINEIFIIMWYLHEEHFTIIK